jgi:hypothetical protein
VLRIPSNAHRKKELRAFAKGEQPTALAVQAREIDSAQSRLTARLGMNDLIAIKMAQHFQFDIASFCAL